MSQLNLFKFLRLLLQVALPSPDGPLSREVPSTTIAPANKEVEIIVIEGSILLRKRLLPEFHTEAERELRI